MIVTFADKNTKRLWTRQFVKKFSAFTHEAYECLVMLSNARSLGDLAFPPSNELHKLKGERKGQWAITVNDQYRLCFNWGKDNNAYDVEITDYH